MAIKKAPVCLYFIRSQVATPEEVEDAEKLEADVKFRNASAYREGASIEKADFIAGAAPEAYAKAYGDEKTMAPPLPEPEPETPASAQEAPAVRDPFAR